MFKSIGHSRFAVFLTGRVIFLFTTLLILAFIFADGRLLFVQIILVITAAIQVFEFVHFVNQTNKELHRCFTSLINSDFTVNFSSPHLSRSIGDLNESFNDVVKAFREVKVDREAQFHFFQMVVKHIDVGILAVDHHGEIILMNEPAKELLGTPNIKYWKQLKKHRESFVEYVDSMEDGTGELMDLKTDRDLRNITIRKSSVQISEDWFVLISFQDIRTEIEMKEAEAWHKLIRILTHEIMNSITPLVSMTDTMIMLLEGNNGAQKRATDLNEEQVEDMHYSLKTIRERGKGLLHFVSDYRKLTRIPKPLLQLYDVHDLIVSMEQLMSAELERKGIDFIVDVDPHTGGAMMDKALIEQVIINLLTNAMHAVEQDGPGEIRLQTKSESNKVLITVADNGSGIDADKLEQIFVPFFSTKTSGSGIGLSLSRNIMHLHKGSISVHSEPGAGATFTLTLPPTPS